LDNILGNDVHYPSILSVEFMPKPARNLAKTRSLFKGHGGMLRTSQAVRLGVHPRTLYALPDSGELLSIGRGLYRLAKAPPLPYPRYGCEPIPTPRSPNACRFFLKRSPHFVSRSSFRACARLYLSPAAIDEQLDAA
jgi:hypothetical protein